MRIILDQPVYILLSKNEKNLRNLRNKAKNFKWQYCYLLIVIYPLLLIFNIENFRLIAEFREIKAITPAYSIVSSHSSALTCNTSPLKTTSTVVGNTILGSPQLILKNQHQAQVTAMKTIPLTPVLHTASTSHNPVSLSYQHSPLTFALLKSKDSGESVAITGLVVKPNGVDGEQPVSSPTVSSGMPESVQYVTLQGNQVYVPAPASFRIPVSGE